MAKELRITFKESELWLYDFIKCKSSPSAFLKDLAAFEKSRQDMHLKNDFNNIQKISEENNVKSEVKDLADLDISDLD